MVQHWYVLHLDATRSFIEVVADLTTENTTSTEFEGGILAMEPMALNIMTRNMPKKLITWNTTVPIPFLGQLNMELVGQGMVTCMDETTNSPVYYMKVKM